MKDGPQVPVEPTKPSQSTCYRITGRIRDENNLPVIGYMVQAYDNDPVFCLHPDNGLGEAITDEDGTFEIIFDETAFVESTGSGTSSFAMQAYFQLQSASTPS